MSKMQKQIFRILLRYAYKRKIEVIIDASIPLGEIDALWFIRKNSEYIVLDHEKLRDLDRKNFVFAHEIGHSVLHKGKLNSTLYQDNNWNNEYRKGLEAEADKFAQNLLEKLVKVVS